MLKINLFKKSDLSLIKEKLIFSKNRLLKIIYSQQKKYQQIEEILTLLNSINLQNEDPTKIKEILESPLLASEEQIKQYTANTPYRYIDIFNITNSDQKILRKLCINLEYLKMNARFIDETGIVEQVELSEYEIIYADNYEKKYKHCPNWEKIVQKNVINKNDYNVALKKKAIEKGCIFGICPFTGKLISSNSSFLIGFPTFYRFVSNQVFYLIIFSNIRGYKHLLYFPQEELIININRHFLLGKKDINQLKLFFLELRKDVFTYITRTEPKKTTVIIGSDVKGSQISHYLINTLSAVDNFKESIIKVDKITIITTKPLFFGKISEIFPELAVKDIEILDRPSNRELFQRNKELFQHLLKSNAFYVIAKQFHYVTENLAIRIQTNSRKQCSEEFLKNLQEIRNKHFPLMMVQLRSGQRKWLSQIEGVINIINTLVKVYPNLGVVFDGYSRIPFEEDDEKLIELVNKEKEIVQGIRESLTVNVPIYDTCGCLMYESIIWTSVIDFYFSTVGSGMAKPVWIANKPGVTHEPAMLNLPKEERSYWAEWHSVLWRENGKMPLCVPKEFITDYPSKIKHWRTTDYDFDWRIAYKEIIRLISLLPENRY